MGYLPSYELNKFFSTQGLKFNDISIEEYQEALKQSNNMQSFPAKNSVKITGDILILKLS
jgi:hypothetical protein